MPTTILKTMTEKEKLRIYEEKIEKLLKDITEIKEIHQGQPMSFISSKIMARLREEYIFVKNSYIKEFEKKNVKATIDPYAEEVKPLLEGVDEEGRGDNQYTKIYAYSFGPFRPRYFFEGNLKKFLWIVWEPYLCDMIQMRGRSEGIAKTCTILIGGKQKKIVH